MGRLSYIRLVCIIGRRWLMRRYLSASGLLSSVSFLTSRVVLKMSLNSFEIVIVNSKERSLALRLM